MARKRNQPGAPNIQERILREVIGLIARHGADRVTHRLLASALKMSPGTLTYHFKVAERLARVETELGAVKDQLDRIETRLERADD